MTDHVGMPGPGGSLGACSICGDNFMSAVLHSLEQLQSIISEHGTEYDNVACHLPEGPLRKCLEGDTE